MTMSRQERGKLGAAAQRAKHGTKDFATWGAKRGGPRLSDDKCRRCDANIKIGNRTGFCRNCQREKGLPELKRMFAMMEAR
jgi:hypothetical protein